MKKSRISTTAAAIGFLLLIMMCPHPATATVSSASSDAYSCPDGLFLAYDTGFRHKPISDGVCLPACAPGVTPAPGPDGRLPCIPMPPPLVVPDAWQINMSFGYHANGLLEHDGPAGGRGQVWNQSHRNRGENLRDSTGSVTGVGYKAYNMGGPDQWGRPGLSLLEEGLRNFDTKPTNKQQFRIFGLKPDSVVGVYLISSNAERYRRIGGHQQRSHGEWTTKIASVTALRVDNTLGENGETWEHGNNFVFFNGVVVDANGEIVFDGKSFNQFPAFDNRLPLNGFQIMSTLPDTCAQLPPTLPPSPAPTSQPNSPTTLPTPTPTPRPTGELDVPTKIPPTAAPVVATLQPVAGGDGDIDDTCGCFDSNAPEESGTRCFPSCEMGEGSTGVGPICLDPCPEEGFLQVGLHCLKQDSYERTNYGADFPGRSTKKVQCEVENPNCGETECCEQFLLQWYPKCKTGFFGSTMSPSTCVRKCPDSFLDVGAFCQRDVSSRGLGSHEPCIEEDLREQATCIMETWEESRSDIDEGVILTAFSAFTDSASVEQFLAAKDDFTCPDIELPNQFLSDMGDCGAGTVYAGVSLDVGTGFKAVASAGFAVDAQGATTCYTTICTGLGLQVSTGVTPVMGFALDPSLSILEGASVGADVDAVLGAGLSAAAGMYLTASAPESPSVPVFEVGFGGVGLGANLGSLNVCETFFFL